MNRIRMETQRPRPFRKRRILIVSALVVSSLTVLLLGGAWKWGWLGGTRGIEERVFDLGNGVELTLCWCPPGTFMMGSPATEAGRQEDEVQHEVTLTRGFWMAKTETTQEQWETVMAGNPSVYKGKKLPVDSVTWKEAQDFAAALTEQLRRDLEPGWEFRLPTEAQWEYACRAGTATSYHTGDGEAALRKAGWYAGNSGRKISRFTAWLQSLPVIGGKIKASAEPEPKPEGAKEANEFGLQDMHGNVWEWCEDWYGAYREGRVVDPVEPLQGKERVVRGGYWGIEAAGCRAAYRAGTWPDAGGDFLGFRVCLVPARSGNSWNTRPLKQDGP